MSITDDHLDQIGLCPASQTSPTLYRPLIGSMDDGASSTLGAVTDATRRKAWSLVGLVEASTNLEIQTLWGIGSSSEHATGRAVDFMVTARAGGWLGGTEARAVKFGDLLAEAAWEMRDAWDLGWIIWRQRIRSTSPGKPTGWQPMADRGSSTQNHMDHPHIYWRSDRMTSDIPPSRPIYPDATPHTPAPTGPTRTESSSVYALTSPNRFWLVDDARRLLFELGNQPETRDNILTDRRAGNDRQVDLTLAALRRIGYVSGDIL